ncbi:MAG: BTAD domain-containing putative transcriptional regulator [Evtepia sp.]
MKKDYDKISADITMFGSFTISTNRAVLTDSANRSQKIWSVLAYLILHRNRAIPISELIDVFWENDGGSNPSGALKTLLYRARAMLEPLFISDNISPIVPQRGAYRWNEAIVCHVDIDRFELLCHEGNDESMPIETRIERYQSAIRLYPNDFLPKLSDQFWVVSLMAHYHTLYLSSVKNLLSLLEQVGHFNQIVTLCLTACKLEPLDETIHIHYIRALLHQSKYSLAKQHYESITEEIYRQLGTKPSDELRELYAQIMDEEEDLETDLEMIQSQLCETASRSGAFLCEYGFFREVYRLEARRTLRNGSCIHVALLTVTLPNGKIPPLKLLTSTMNHLLEILLQGLRRGDVFAKYSPAQYVILLPAANFEDSSMVMDRVIAEFYHQHRRTSLKFSYKVREIENNSYHDIV